MNAKHALVLACAAMCAAGLAEGATTQERPGSSRFNPVTAEQALQIDAQRVSEALGISFEAALSRLNVDGYAGPIVERIRTQYANRLAGIYIEHEPIHRLVVRLTGYGVVRPEFYQFGADQLEVNYQLGAEHTFSDLQKRFENGFAALKRRLPSLQSGYVDERTGQIVIEVLRGQEASNPLAFAQEQLATNHFGTDARLVQLDEPFVNQAVKGSGRLDIVQSSTSTLCTGGFTVKTVSSLPVTYGLLTAGHCQPDNGVFNYTEALGTTTDTLTHVARKFDADTDIGWAATGTTASDVTPDFYSGTWRQVFGSFSKASTTVGMTMCGYGNNGGSRCGEVISKAFNPGSICGPGVTIGSGTDMCSAVYVRVDLDPMTTTGLCLAGDSGGPWNILSLAAGIHKAGQASGLRCVYTSIDDISASTLNVQLVL